MRLSAPGLANDATFETHDLFRRGDLGAGLTRLLTTIKEPLVIALDGQWGTGKTTFLQLWERSLAAAGIPVIHFDAFEHDYFDDPFLALAGEVVALAQAKKIASQTPAKRLLDKAVGVGRVLAVSGAKVAVKVGSATALDAEHVASEIAKAVSDEASKLVEAEVRSLLKNQKKQRTELESFRTALSDLSLVLSGSVDRPLIFVIDELDRCKPAFALLTLERIKHLFQVKNVHFVFGVNLNQLQKSVVSEYGVGIDAEKYLQKFINLIFRLADYERTSDARATNIFIDHLAKEMGFWENNRNQIEDFLFVIKHYAASVGSNLREIEMVMRVAAISYACSDPNGARPPIILAGLCIMKSLAPDLFEQAQMGTLGMGDVEKTLRIPPFLAPEDRIQGVGRITAWWGTCLGAGSTEAARQYVTSALANYAIQPSEVVRYVANKVVNRLEPQPGMISFD